MVRQEDRLMALLGDAHAADIDVEFAESPRSLRELKAISNEILRTDLSRSVAVGWRSSGSTPPLRS
jgi:hypothetical protein